MHVFASELMTSGGGPGLETSASLRGEGRAMLSALLADLCAVDGIRVSTTCSASFQPPDVSGIDVITTHSPDDERSRFRQLAAEADATLVIAPEIDGTLARRRRLVDSAGGRFIGPTLAAIELTADKLLLAEHLKRHDLSTIPTEKLERRTAESSHASSVVVKPRFGVGSTHTYLCEAGVSPEESTRSAEFSALPSDFVVQPFVAGEAVSVGVIVADKPADIEILPMGEQILSDDGRFRYLGGRIPSHFDVRAGVRNSVERLVTGVCRSIPGLTGYFGLDLILPVDEETDPVIVEINPRLTTGYLGYRQLTLDNLAERILFPDRQFPKIRWSRHSVTFYADGRSEPGARAGGDLRGKPGGLRPSARR